MQSDFVSVYPLELDSFAMGLICKPLTFIDWCAIRVIILPVTFLLIFMIHPLEFLPVSPSIDPEVFFHSFHELSIIGSGRRHKHALPLE